MVVPFDFNDGKAFESHCHYYSQIFHQLLISIISILSVGVGDINGAIQNILYLYLCHLQQTQLKKYLVIRCLNCLSHNSSDYIICTWNCFDRITIKATRGQSKLIYENYSDQFCGCKYGLMVGISFHIVFHKSAISVCA